MKTMVTLLYNNKVESINHFYELYNIHILFVSTTYFNII